jgi:hypothetical protein
MPKFIDTPHLLTTAPIRYPPRLLHYPPIHSPPPHAHGFNITQFDCHKQLQKQPQMHSHSQYPYSIVAKICVLSLFMRCGQIAHF